jgi:hypothetical protein
VYDPTVNVRAAAHDHSFPRSRVSNVNAFGTKNDFEKLGRFAYYDYEMIQIRFVLLGSKSGEGSRGRRQLRAGKRKFYHGGARCGCHRVCQKNVKLLDKGRDLRDITSSRFTIDEPWHSTRRSLLEAIEVVARVLAHLVSGEAASFSLGGVERSAKFGGLDLIDSVANGVLRRQKPPGGKLRLHPLGCVRCKFNFHGTCSFRKSFPYQGPLVQSTRNIILQALIG